MVMHMQLIDACAQIQDVDVTDLEAALKEECLNILSKSYSTPPQDTLQQSFSIDRRAATVYDVGSSTSDAGRAEIHEDEDKYTDAMALSVNYHPPCPHPELVLGSEPCFARCPFEIVLQNEVLGLQVFKEGRWRTLKPEPDALVVIVGKALEVSFCQMLEDVAFTCFYLPILLKCGICLFAPERIKGHGKPV